MSTNVPTISVTKDTNKDNCQHSTTSSDSENDSESLSNDMDYKSNIGSGVTDVEDLDSNMEFNRSSTRILPKNNLLVPKDPTNTQGDVTDVEDYNDCEADEGDADKSGAFLELKLSLEEFLQNDVQEHFSTTNGIKEVVEHKAGDFLQAQNLNGIIDYLTDCEEYNTDSEIENNCEKSVCVDLNETFVDQGKVNIADAVTVTSKDHKEPDCEYEDVSEISDISDLALAISDVMGRDIQGQSEDEMLELSGNEEVCQISCSDSESSKHHEYLSEEDLLSSASLPPIDVTFMQPCNRAKLEIEQFAPSISAITQTCKRMYLKVEENKKGEVLTDIERFDDSVAEGDDDSFDSDDDNQQPIPQAVILAIGDDGACHTDCEDINFDDISEMTGSSAEIALSVDHKAIPPPHREVVVLQENKYGDTVTNVMPMDKDYQFGIYATLKEECFTDTEDFSCAEDIDVQELSVNLPSRPPSSNNLVMVEPDVTVANEVLKTQQSKRLEIIANTESVTDVEEIYMAGTNSRRKKLKTRTVSKSKSKYLEASRVFDDLSGGGTDIEDMDFSESGLLPTNKPISKSEQNIQASHSLTDKATDVEDIAIDDVSSLSDIEPPQIDVNITNLKDYESNSKNSVVSSETGSITSNVKYNKLKKISASHFPRVNELTSYHNQQQHTDIEDIQLPSDAEDCLHFNEEVSSDAICPELNEMLNECCTTVHDKCTNSFNMDAEKLHIKGMLRESHTDIEYVESDESAARGSK